MKRPNTQIISVTCDNKRYIEADCIVAWLKDELLLALSEDENDVFASDFLKDRLKVFKSMRQRWKDKYGH